MKIDLSCPVELRRCQLPTTEYPVCEMIFFNLSDKPVSSMQICFLCYDANGEQTVRSVERLPVKDAPARGMFSLDTVIEEAVNVSGMEVAVKKVWFSDGTVWRTGTAGTADFAPTPVLQGNQLQVMQELAGGDAITYPSDQGAVWVCICGRPNAASEDTCRRCGRDKHDIFVNYNEAEIEKIIFQRESAAEEEERQEREKARKAKEEADARARARRHRRRTIIACTVSALIILALAFGYFYYLKPSNRYTTAMRWFNNSRYGDAKDVFRELNDADYFFGKYEMKFTTSLPGTEGELDYAQMIVECDYRAACDALEEGTNLEEAEKAFNALADHPGSTEKAMEARYRIAENKYSKALTESANKSRDEIISAFDEAVSACERVGDEDYALPADEEGHMHLSVSQMILHSRYQQARALENHRDYQAAYDMYTSEEYGLIGYNDSDTRAADCLHTLAAQDMANENYRDAISKYEQLPQFTDTPRQLQAAYYGYACQLLEGKKYDEAAAYFDRAGKYLDAEYLSKYECRYAPAKDLMEEGKAEKDDDKLREAGQKFKELTNYTDSAEMYCECQCLRAELCLEQEDYEGALALLKETDGIDYRRKDEVRFVIAKAYLDSNMEEEALRQFEEIPDFVISADTGEEGGEETEESSFGYIRQICYGRALTVAGEAEAAAGKALSSKDRQACAAAAGSYSEAADLFETLADYNDSGDRLVFCRYNEALLYIEAGMYEDAIGILTNIPDYKDAAEKTRLATYRQAAALEEAEDYEGALTIYRGLENYADVRDRREHCAVELANAEIAAGDLEAAFEWLEGCTGAEAKNLRDSMGFTLAQEMEENGDLIGAATRYDALGNYNGSKERAAACRKAYYSGAAETVKTAMSGKDYLTVIETLDNLDMSAVGNQYESLEESYEEACYLLANKLYADGDAFTAYTYYMKVQDYKDVKSKKLNRPCYLIFGKWEDSTGEVVMEFRADGTCYFYGKECYYRVNGPYDLRIGDLPDDLNQKYELVSGPSRKNNNLTIGKLPGNKPLYRLTRSAEE